MNLLVHVHLVTKHLSVMDNLPKDFKSGFDYSIFISEKDSKWIETEKFEKIRNGNISNSVGSFRNDLKKLKEMRREMGTEKNKNIKSECEYGNNAILMNFNATTTETATFDDVVIKSIEINNKSFTKPSNLNLTPSNPLMDQTIKIIKPTEWIDCISRESKRVFVKDNWIVARILLPSVSKDLIGLKLLKLELELE